MEESEQGTSGVLKHTEIFELWKSVKNMNRLVIVREMMNVISSRYSRAIDEEEFRRRLENFSKAAGKRTVHLFNKDCMGLCTSVRVVDLNGEQANFVKDTIATYPIVIFSKTYCPYCAMAKKVFKKLNRAYTTIELDKREDGTSIQDVLQVITGARTVPRVFVHGQFVGGGTDVKALYESGKLQEMLGPVIPAT